MSAGCSSHLSILVLKDVSYLLPYVFVLFYYSFNLELIFSGGGCISFIVFYVLFEKDPYFCLKCVLYQRFYGS